MGSSNPPAARAPPAQPTTNPFVVCPPRAQAEFNDHKGRFIDIETQKRMLEEIWQDQVYVDPSDERKVEDEEQTKKAELKKQKQANEDQQARVQAKALELEAAIDARRKQIEELQTQLRDAEHSQATAAEQVTQLTAQTAQANEQITRSFTETQQADKDIVDLNKQLDSARAAHTEMAQRAQRTTQECERMALTLEQTKKQSQAVGAMQAERSAWYEQVTMQLSALSGIRGASMHEGGLLRYELAPPYALLVSFDGASGRLASASLEVHGGASQPAGDEIADIEAHAVRTNSLEFLLREATQRLGLIAPMPPPTFVEVAPTPVQPPQQQLQLQQQAAAAAAAAIMPPAAPTPVPGGSGGSSETPIANLNQRLSHAAAHGTPAGASHAAAAAATPADGANGTPGWLRGAAHHVGLEKPAAAAPAPAAPAAPTPAPFAATPVPGARAAPSINPPSLPSSVPGGHGGAAPFGTPAPFAAMADTVARPEYGGGVGYAAAADQAAGAATVPRSEYAAPRYAPPTAPHGGTASATAGATPFPGAPGSILTVRDVAASDVSVLDSARHQKRSSRKSFSRAVSHPRSPASRAANRGISMDAKQAVSMMQAVGGDTPIGGGAFGEPQLSVLDALGVARATVAPESAGCSVVRSAEGRVLGYINANGDVGAPDDSYLGQVMPPSAQCESGTVANADDEPIGSVDYGRATLLDLHGSTVAELRKGGTVTGHRGEACGRLDGFDYHKMQLAAAYIMLIDPAFVHGK